MSANPSAVVAVFQAPTCRSLGLELEVHLRNTNRQLGSGALQESEAPLSIDLSVYQQGRTVLHDPSFGSIASGGSLIIRERDLIANMAGSGEEELLFVARIRRPESVEYFPQEHQLSYTSASGTQAYLLYDQQPLRTDSSRPAPIVLMMPKIWLSDSLNTHIVVSNASHRQDVMEQPEPVIFSLLDPHGRPVYEWQQRFYYNEARAFDLKRRVQGHVRLSERPAFFNLIGRGGSGSFVLFAVVRNEQTQHLAIEHSLPPMYYMDGDMGRVRAEACMMPKQGASTTK